MSIERDMGYIQITLCSEILIGGICVWISKVETLSLLYTIFSFIFLFMYPIFIYLYIYIFINSLFNYYLFIYLFMYLFSYLFMYLFIYLSNCLFIHSIIQAFSQSKISKVVHCLYSILSINFILIYVLNIHF